METVSVSQRDCLPSLTQAEHLYVMCLVSSAGPIAYHVDVSQRPVQLYVHAAVVTSPPLLQCFLQLFSPSVAVVLPLSRPQSALASSHALSVTLPAFARRSLLLFSPNVVVVLRLSHQQSVLASCRGLSVALPLSHQQSALASSSLTASL